MPASRPQRQMIKMDVTETSGVDHPAHGFEGWLVRKAADPNQVARLRALVRKDNAMPKLTKDELVAEVRKSKAPDAAIEALVKAIDLQPDVDAAAQLWQSLKGKLEAGDPETPSVSGQGEAPAAAAPVAAAPAPAAAVPNLFKSVTDPDDRAALIKMVADNAKLAADLELAKGETAKERDIRLDSEAVALSKSAYPHLAIDHEQVAPALRKMAISDPDSYALVKAGYDQAEAQLDSAGMFAELGTSRAAVGGGALAKASKIAEGYVAAGVSPDMDSAMAKAWQDNQKLYTEYEEERGI